MPYVSNTDSARGSTLKQLAQPVLNDESRHVVARQERGNSPWEFPDSQSVVDQGVAGLTTSAAIMHRDRGVRELRVEQPSHQRAGGMK